MHLLTHVLTGWVAGNVLGQVPKVRALCMGVSLLPGIDGLSLIGGIECYQTYHHVIAHNLCFSVVLCSLTACFTTERVKKTVLFIVLYNLHILMDVYGSGIGWGIAYLYPYSTSMYFSTYAWEFSGWQNFLALTSVIITTILIALFQNRTPMEFVAPRFNGIILKILKSRTSR
jgi:hypothetical protein